MRSSILLPALCAALAMASPINKAVHKKAIVYDIDVVTDTVCVTVTATAGEVSVPTVAAQPVVTIQTTVTAPSVTDKSSTAVVSTSTSTPAPSPPPAPTTSTSASVSAATTSVAPVGVESTVAAAVTTSTTAAASGATPTDYQSTAIYHHTLHRANHSASALVWNDTLATYSLATANTCVFAHDLTEGTGGYGQNIAAYGTSGDIASLSTASVVADAITNQWYYGEAANVPYGVNDPVTTNVPEFLHFTALVWKASTQVGCATVQCGAGTIFSYHSLFTVCDYTTEGNILGEFIANVAEPIDNPSITASIS